MRRDKKKKTQAEPIVLRIPRDADELEFLCSYFGGNPTPEDEIPENSESIEIKLVREEK